MITKFSPEVQEELKFYVYRLVDPRTGQTFYVGKGKGNRVFEHIKAADEIDKFYSEHKDDYDLQNDDDDDSTKLKNEDPVKKIDELKQEDPEKLKKIKEIKDEGLEVIHIIQRYGLEDNETALEIEAAFIDFFSLDLLTNRQKGHGCDKGMIWADALEQKYKRSYFEENNPKCSKFMIIKINQHSIDLKGSVYEAVRSSWKINLEKAKNYPVVLAVKYGIVVGVYNVKNGWKRTEDGYRAYFDGEEAPLEIKSLFFDKRIPEKYRKRQNPISYCDSKMETEEPTKQRNDADASGI